MKNRIGFCHGDLNRVLDIYSKEAFDIYSKNCGNEAIEISTRVNEIDNLDKIIPFVKKFSYKSVHLPSNIKYQKDSFTNEVLDKMVSFYKKIEADLILLHPNTVDDWDIFNKYPFNWAVENMDCRQSEYKETESFKNFFQKNKDWKLVLDLNHCYTNDRSMKLADDFINEFGNRIAEVHLSGLIDYHEPLFKTKQDIILEYCKKIESPIIIESTFDSVSEVEKEMRYIKNYL